MHSFSLVVLALGTVALVQEAIAGGHHATSGTHLGASKHRRHHTKRASSYSTCKSSAASSSGSDSDSDNSDSDYGSSSSSDSTSSSGTATSTNVTSNSGSSSTFGLSSSLLAVSDVYVGFLPDDGDAGGTRQTMAQINEVIGGKSAAYGWYAQAQSGTTFDGSQLLTVMDDVKACNCVFQPAVMPTKGWKGLTASDNSQAVNIAKVMKKFTDEGITVWLRFAHEMNYYQSDGTYSGTAADFKAGWAAVAAAVKQYAPEAKMFWTPNVASADSYAKYEPDDMSTVDLVGVDYYPKSLKDGNFVSTMKAFHDKYAVDGRQFAIGETGLGYAGSIDDRMAWLKQIVESKSSLPQLTAISWFNYQKGYDFKIAQSGDAGTKLKALLAA